MNKVFLSGRLTKDPELRYSANSTAYARCGIAVNRAFKKDEVDFFNLIAFGKTAEFLGNWFSKGAKLLVEGHIQNSSYEDKEGNKRTSTDIIVDAVEFADSKKSSGGNKGNGTDKKLDSYDDDMTDVPF